MTAGSSSAQRRAYARFKGAIVDFSDDPSPDNLVRYLAASRALDESSDRRSATARSSDPTRSRPR